MKIYEEEDDDEQPASAAVKKARVMDVRHKAAGLFVKDRPAADMDAERDRALAWWRDLLRPFPAASKLGRQLAACDTEAERSVTFALSFEDRRAATLKAR
eukprot:9920106-Heterocapsa_arctica.AAC.1